MAARRLAPAAATAAAVLLLPAAAAQAHTVSTTAGDFYAGALHVASSPEHLLTLLGLGLLLGQNGREAASEPLLPLLVATLALGAALALPIGAAPIPRALGIVSLLLVGLLVAAAVRLPRPALAILTLAVGLAHGFANAEAMIPGMRPFLFFPGIALAGFLLVFYGMALARLARPFWATVAVRVAGSWIAATGLLVLGMPR